MTWTSPMTFTANTVLTAAQLNTHLRDNLLETAPSKATTATGYFCATGANSIAERIMKSAQVLTAETTASTAYVDLATLGPAVTCDTSLTALVFVTVGLRQSAAATGIVYADYEVTGATSRSPSDGTSAYFSPPSGNPHCRTTAVHMADLTSGSNTFTMKYRCDSGTGDFRNRRITVMPL